MFQVTPDDISRLDEQQAIKLLDQLLHLEASAAKIPLSNVKVSLKRYTIDGGEDGSIKWTGADDRTDFLPGRYVQFQVKATAQSDSMTPANCANEIAPEDKTQPYSSRTTNKKKEILIRKLRPAIECALDNGACYILFCTEKFGPTEQIKRLKAMRDALKLCGKSYADSAQLEIYDAQRIAKWTNKYIATIAQVIGWAGKLLPANVLPWTLWSKHDELNRFKYIYSPANQQHIDKIRNYLTSNEKYLRIVGLPGLGKTRLVMEACRPQGKYDALDKAINSSIAYIDMNQLTNTILIEFLGILTRTAVKGAVIIDNCSFYLHKRCLNDIRYAKDLKMITLNYEPSHAMISNILQVCQEEDDIPYFPTNNCALKLSKNLSKF